jgi:hypothetical protein
MQVQVLFFEHSLITIQEGMLQLRVARQVGSTHFLSSIASIDFSPPAVLSGSSDKHIRFFDMTTLQGWSTLPKDDTPTGNCDILPFSFGSGSTPPTNSGPSACDLDSSHHEGTTSLVCQDCGSNRFESRMSQLNRQAGNCAHGDLVRTVALKQDFVLSGSYDSSIKVIDHFGSWSGTDADIDLRRFGIERRAFWWLISLVVTQARYFASGLIRRRYSAVHISQILFDSTVL